MTNFEKGALFFLIMAWVIAGIGWLVQDYLLEDDDA